MMHANMDLIWLENLIKIQRNAIGSKSLKFYIIVCRWKLVEIDADLMKLTCEIKHVMSLISPAKTYMVFF